MGSKSTFVWSESVDALGFLLLDDLDHIKDLRQFHEVPLDLPEDETGFGRRLE